MHQSPIFGHPAGGNGTAAARGVIALLLAMAALTVSCKDVRVSAVDVARLEIEPVASLIVGDSAHLNAKLLDAAGNELRGRTISWTSAEPDVATVDPDGRVRGLSPGSTVISAASEGARDEVLLVIAARPVLATDPLSVTLTARAGGPPPPATTILVSADGPVTDLSVSIGFAQGQPTGWLVASLTDSSAPAILMLDISTDGLDAGAYDATVIVDAPTAAGQRTVPVTLLVQPRLPAIGLSRTAVPFNAVQLGPDPFQQTVAVTNEGDGLLDGLNVATAYPGGQPVGWLRANLAATTAPTTLTLEPITGTLAAGRYSATVLVSSAAADNSPRAIDVSFVVDPAPPAIRVSTPAVILGGTAGGPDPAPTTVVITNGGGGQLSGLSTSITHPPGEPAGWLDISMSSSQAPAVLTLIASTAALAIGSYTATVEIAAADASIAPVTLTVTLNVGAPVQAPEIGASATAIAVMALEGGADPAAELIDITNTGGGTLDGLALTISHDAGQPTGWLEAALTGTTAPTGITVQARTGTLVAGTYGATIDVSSPAASNSPLSIDVEFIVRTPSVINISEDELDFDGATGGPDPQAQNTDITNAGAGTLDGLAATVAYAAGQPTGWLNVVLNATTAPATLTVQAIVGSLAAGTYDATIDVTSAAASNSPQTIDVSFTLQSILLPAAPTLTEARLHRDHVHLEWDDNSSNETSFIVQRSLSATGGWVDIATLKENSDSDRDDNITAGQTYYYRIAACNLAGCTYSNVLSVTY